MGQIARPHKVNLITGLLASSADTLAKSKEALMRAFGAIDFASPVLDFTQTDYYAEEMGGGLKRQFLSFENLFDLDGIWTAKLKTNELEERFTHQGKRPVNIDPGYIDDAKCVLFSTKDYSHRIHLDKGIFAEVTLFYKEGSFRPWPWTYPDYKTGAYIEILNHIREIYRKKKR